jgi:c-di-GMP-binding flagellar brake protein YcgR
MGAERRHRFRSECDAPIHWRPREGADNEWRGGTLLDISTGGGRIASPEAPVHHILSVGLRLEANDVDRIVVMTAELVRIMKQLPSGEFVWAVQWINLDEQVRTLLTRFVFGEAWRRQAAEAR